MNNNFRHDEGLESVNWLFSKKTKGAVDNGACASLIGTMRSKLSRFKRERRASLDFSYSLPGCQYVL